MGKGAYGDVDFWNEYYVVDRPDPYDWFFPFEHIEHMIPQLMSHDDRILMPGCGNAPFSVSLHECGYCNQVNFDYCELVIEQQRQRYPQMSWDVMDVRSMNCKDESFDVVFDKGLLDNLQCYMDAAEHCISGIREMYRVLKKGGKYILLSCHAPEKIEELLEASGCGWNWQVYRLRNPRFPEIRLAGYTLVVATRDIPDGGVGRLEDATSKWDGDPILLSSSQLLEAERRVAEFNAASNAQRQAQQEQWRQEQQEQLRRQEEAQQNGPPSLAEQLSQRRGSLRSSLTERTPSFTFQLQRRRSSLRNEDRSSQDGSNANST